MRSPPPDLTADRLTAVLAEGWGLRAASLAYLPEGGGSHHWTLTDPAAGGRFVTVDDLTRKPWLNQDGNEVYGGLRSALATAVILRHQSGLRFVVAPFADRDGEPLRAISARYTVSVFPLVAGTAFPFGRYTDSRLRERVVGLMAELHRATPAVREIAPRHRLGFSGRAELEGFLLRPDLPWTGGVLGEDARAQLMTATSALARLVTGFDRLAAATSADRSACPVLTHGEPHPANVVAAGPDLLLVDWDTAGLGPPERDLAMIASDDADADDSADRYREATGRALSPAILALYRLRWYLDDVGSAVRLFACPHSDTADSRRWHTGLATTLAGLPQWLDLVNSWRWS